MKRKPEGRIHNTHLERQALIYVRQSTTKQVRENEESARIQRGLREKAIALGWRRPVIIDEDLGISASGFADRLGFQRLITEVTLRRVGIIFCYEASRLSRNSKDWAELLELCGFFQTLLADLDQVYDVSQPNDRLLLGIKGTLAAMELTSIVRRLSSGREAKAERGELKIPLPVGYVYDWSDKIAIDPDKRVQEALRLLFDQFDRFSSLRQQRCWYRDNKILFPVGKGIRGSRKIVWQIPSYSTLRNCLSNPMYAGAYVWGRSETRVEFESGKLIKRVRELPEEEWRVCLKDHHPAYLSWERFLKIRGRLAENQPRWSMRENRGAPREGLALLSGLLRCGHCGNKIHVAYKRDSAFYFCQQGEHDGTTRCLSFGAVLIDRHVSEESEAALSSLALEASISAADQRRDQDEKIIETVKLKIAAAQYEADRAFEQYDHCDPKNRHVADTLENRLNAKLAVLEDAKSELAELESSENSLTREQKKRIEDLAGNFTELWNHPKAEAKLKKRILRLLIEEIVVNHDKENSRLEVIIHWAGDSHTRGYVKKKKGRRGGKTNPEILVLIRRLANEVEDAEIARILNMQGLKTARGLRWNQSRVRDMRRVNKIVSRTKPKDPAIFNYTEAHSYLGIGGNGLRGLVRLGAVDPNQITDFAPWRVKKVQLDSKQVRDLVNYLKSHGRLPRKGGCSTGQTALFSEKPSSMESGAL